MQAMKTRTERARLAALSHLVADALGVPYEFNAPERIPAPKDIEFTPPAGFTRSHPRAPKGAYSDDGATFLCLLASLFACGGLDLNDFGRRLVRWFDTGYMAVDGVIFDIGAQTSAAINRLRAGTAPELAGARDERANGNGSLMRVLAVTLWASTSDVSDADLVKMAMRSSLPTHAHPRSLVCCAVYALWARYTLEGLAETSDEAFCMALNNLHNPGMLEEQEQYRELCNLCTLALNEREGSYTPHGTGYVVDSLLAAVQANRGKASYESVVKAAIAFGNDTDTTACIAGPIAALRFGNIPARWILDSAVTHLGKDAAQAIANLCPEVKP